jgi:hypothetical protein
VYFKSVSVDRPHDEIERTLARGGGHHCEKEHISIWHAASAPALAGASSWNNSENLRGEYCHARTCQSCEVTAAAALVNLSVAGPQRSPRQSRELYGGPGPGRRFDDLQDICDRSDG